MDKLNPTSPATNSNRETSTPSVLADAPPEREGLSRRSLMQLATSAAAVPAIALIGTTSVAAQPVERSAWDRAVARLRSAEARYARLSRQGDVLSDAAEAACPRRGEFFSRYDLGCGWSRERNVRAARQAIIVEAFAGRSPLGRILTMDEKANATAEANRVVDEFEAWQRRHEEAWREYDAWEKLHDEAVDQRHDAKKHLLEMAAPDHQALLFKIEVFAKEMDEAALEDAPSMAHIHDDARRLLSRASRPCSS